MRRSLLPLLIALAGLAGCAREQAVQVAIENEAEAEVIVWLYRDGPAGRGGLLSPGAYAAIVPSEPGFDELAGSPATPIPPGRATLLKTRARRGADLVLAVFGTAKTLDEMAAEPERSETVARILLGPGTNLVRVESAVPTRAVRVLTSPTSPNP